MDLQRELQSKNRNFPIVFITGHGDIPMSVNAMKAGAVDFLPKPVKDTDLLRAIEQALVRAARDLRGAARSGRRAAASGNFDVARARSDAFGRKRAAEQNDRF